VAAGKSMSEVARAIGVTTVYYSEVEMGRKRPFSSANIDFVRLASELQIDRLELEELAATERGTVEFRLDGKAPHVRRLALLMASKLTEGALTEEEVQSLEAALTNKARRKR
jgi:transcriptional regulator with XRE-family HTH domain